MYYQFLIEFFNFKMSQQQSSLQQNKKKPCMEKGEIYMCTPPTFISNYQTLENDHNTITFQEFFVQITLF